MFKITCLVASFLKRFDILSYSVFLSVFITFLVSATPAKAQVLPAGFSQVMVANGIRNPTTMTFAPDGRLFVAQQTGQLWIVKKSVLLARPFITLNVDPSGERGLLGIAFDPSFSTNHYIYLYYTLPSGANNRISRLTANGDTVVPGSEVLVLNLDALSTANNHNGGSIHFGKDGKLYVAVGENAHPANSQNLDTHLGKILRINADGSVPQGNPFTTGSEQRKRVWEYGLRNPFTFSIQPVTGRIFVDEVGQNTWEEVNDCTSGGHNYGWPDVEGMSSNSLYTNPVYTYKHGTGIGVGCAITGGTFFNPAATNYPSLYVGKYFFLDYCGSWIDMLTLSGTSVTRANFASSIAGSNVAMATGPDGNLYFLSRANSAVYKITYTTSHAPVITNQPQSITVSQGHSASFSVTATGTAPLSYQWKKNGVAISGAGNSTYTISSVATADAAKYSVVVRNASGSVTSNNATLTVTAPNQPPIAKITAPAAGATYTAGDTIKFSGSGTDPEDGTLGVSAFTWFVLFHHDSHTYPGPAAPSGVKSGSFIIPNTGETSANVFYRLYLVVKDSKGASDTAFTDISPRTSTITLNTSPKGLQLTLDGQPFAAPLKVTSVEGMLRTIGAVTPQSKYTFSKWSQGGKATQTIATPVNDVTYTADYILTNDTLTPVADAYVRAGSYSGNNYGPSDSLSLKKATLADFSREVYLRFDISSFTAGIASAKLRLYGSLNSRENASVRVEVHNVTNVSWLENSITWNNKPAAQTTVVATKSITGTQKQYYEWDITQLLFNLRNAGINSVTLKLVNPDITLSHVEFNSKEAALNKPQLVVQQSSSSARPADNRIVSLPVKMNEEMSFSMYPNPAQGNFNVAINNYGGACTVRVHDLNGRLIKEYFISNNEIHQVYISNLKMGVYIVSVENGKNIKSEKIIIEK